MLDNHLADQGQKEYNDKSSCQSCGKGSFYDIDWCDNDGKECSKDCENFHQGYDCPVMIKKIRCSHCGYVTEEQ